MTIPAFPKICSIGQVYIKDIFDGEVEITEKIDGSQFAFGLVNGELVMRSKGKAIDYQSPDKMFEKAVGYVVSIEHTLLDNLVYYCEYLQKPKHNVLAYNMTPINNLILFAAHDVTDDRWLSYEQLSFHAKSMDIDMVPLLAKGMISSAEQLMDFMERPSCLGGCNAEGIVVKNYNKPYMIGGQIIPIMSGKFVSEKFKEVHKNNWGKENTSKGKWDTFKEGYRTEARWQKAVQHLRDKGELEGSPKDIGKLILETKRDIIEEEQENIKEFLWKEFGEELLRKSTAGLPEWWKEQLVKETFQ